MIKVKIINKTDLQQFVDVSMDNKPNGIYAVPPKEAITVEVSNESDFLFLAKKYRKSLVVKKIIL
jgi:hypothetical protein